MAGTRNEKGQFVKGVTGNPNGRPKREVEQEYYNVTIRTVSSDDWQDIIKKAVEQAKEGNGYARTFLADYILGKPVQKTEITLTDAELDALPDSELEKIASGES